MLQLGQECISHEEANWENGADIEKKDWSGFVRNFAKRKCGGGRLSAGARRVPKRKRVKAFRLGMQAQSVLSQTCGRTIADFQIAPEMILNLGPFLWPCFNMSTDRGGDALPRLILVLQEEQHVKQRFRACSTQEVDAKKNECFVFCKKCGPKVLVCVVFQ